MSLLDECVSSISVLSHCLIQVDGWMRFKAKEQIKVWPNNNQLIVPLG